MTSLLRKLKAEISLPSIFRASNSNHVNIVKMTKWRNAWLMKYHFWSMIDLEIHISRAEPNWILSVFGIHFIFLIILWHEHHLNAKQMGILFKYWLGTYISRYLGSLSHINFLCYLPRCCPTCLSNIVVWLF